MLKTPGPTPLRPPPPPPLPPLADGPDEVHWRKAGQIELGRQQGSRLRGLGLYTPARDETEPLFRHTTDPISADATTKLAAFDALMAA